MMDANNHELTLDEPMLTPIQLGETIGLSVSTLAHYRCSGCGPRYLKLGKRVLYKQSDVNEWLQRRTYQSTAEHSINKQR